VTDFDNLIVIETMISKACMNADIQPYGVSRYYAVVT